MLYEVITEEYYVHRIGRTGRAGRTGRSFTFVSGRKQLYALKDIMKYTNSKISLMAIPSLNDVEAIKINNFVKQVKNVLEEGELDRYVKVVEQLMDSDYTSVDIAAALTKLLMSNDKSEEEEDSFEREDFENTGAEPGMVRLV